MQPRRDARGSGARSVRNVDGPRLVAGIQRARLLGATVDAVFDRGAPNVTVSEIVARAGVSRRTFYELFRDRDDCMAAAFEDALARAAARVLPAYESHQRWRDRIRRSLEALLAFLDEDPAVGRLLIVESLGGGRALVERRAQVIERIAEAVDAGGLEASSGKAKRSPLTAEGVVGGVLAVLHARLCGMPRQSLSELASQLTSMVVLPYLGATAAQRELLRPPPAARPGPRSEPGAADSLITMPMRLTYRTTRVLAAIAAEPGSSNREIARAAEIVDQGQASKLLRRLERLRLIANDVAQARPGAPNTWTLTAEGERFQAVAEGRMNGASAAKGYVNGQSATKGRTVPVRDGR